MEKQNRETISLFERGVERCRDGNETTNFSKKSNTTNWNRVQEMSSTSSIEFVTLNQCWSWVRGDNEWNAQQRNFLYIGRNFKTQSAFCQFNATFDLFLIDFRGVNEWNEQNQKGWQFLQRPRGQQFLHRPRRDNSFYTVPTFWERSNSVRTAPTYRIKKFEIHKCRPSVVPTIKEGGEGAGGRPGIGVTKISKPPILSHSQLLGGWVG